MFLTDAGSDFLACARKALEEVEYGVQHLKEMQHVCTGKVRIGVIYSLFQLLNHCVLNFTRAFPEAELSIVYSHSVLELVELINSNKLDFALSYNPQDVSALTESTEYASLPLCVIAHEHHPVAVRKQLDTDNKQLKKKYVAAYEELRDRYRLKADLLAFVEKSGFAVSSYLKQKALLTLDDVGTPIRAKEDARRMGLPEVEEVVAEACPGKKTRSGGDKAEVSSDVLHPELYERLRAWRSGEAARQSLPVYMIFQQKALLGISNLLPVDKEMLSRIPYVGKKVVEKYGDEILQIIAAYRKEKR